MNLLSDQELSYERRWIWYSYLCCLVIIPVPVAVLISGWKLRRYKRLLPVASAIDRSELELLATHHEWILRSIAATLILAMVGIGTAYYIFGLGVLAVVAVWWVYRLARGILALVGTHPLPSLVCTSGRCYGPAADS